MDNSHQWIFDFQDRAIAEDRLDKLNLIWLYMQIGDVSRENPDQKLALCEYGRELSLQFGEPWWGAFFEFWKCEVLLFQKHDPEAALRVAASLVVETRKPQYAAFSQRIAIHANFIAAYLKIDPIGYAAQIRAALDDKNADWEHYQSFYLLYLQSRTRFLTAVNDAEGLSVAWQHFAVACDFHANDDLESSHYTIYALIDLLNALAVFDPVASRQQTAELALMGEELSSRDQNHRCNAIFTMWRAVGARFLGHETEAKRFYLLAMQKQEAIEPPRNAIFQAALAFHAAGGETEEILKICDAAIEIAIEHCHWFDAATYLASKCEALNQTGQSCLETVIKLREVAAKLPSRQYWEAKIRLWQPED